MLFRSKNLKLIVGFEFSISALEGKWKMSQNRTQSDREGVLRNLQEAKDADSQEVAAALHALKSPSDPLSR